MFVFPYVRATTRPGITQAQDFAELARLEWEAAVELGFPHDLSDADREYQTRCFERAEDYHKRAVEAAKLGE